MELQEKLVKYAVAAGCEQQQGTPNFVFSPDNLQEFTNTVVAQCIDIVKHQESKLDMIKVMKEQFPSYKLNEHVYGLAEQAGFKIYGDDTVSGDVKYLAKFAKLITEECISIMENGDGDIDYAIFETKQRML